MQLEFGRSYIHIFVGYAVVFASAMALSAVVEPKIGYAIISITMPLLVGFLLLSQIRSGIALNSWWVARYRRGTWQYTGLIAWNCCGLVFMTVGTVIVMKWVIFE